MKVTVSFTNQSGDIPEYDLTEEELIEQLSLSDDKVYVCFLTSKLAQENHCYDLEVGSFLITSCHCEASEYIFKLQSEDAFIYGVFCFERYDEAFKYCIDLKDGTE
jgi:hypothetical protein